MLMLAELPTEKDDYTQNSCQEHILLLDVATDVMFTYLMQQPDMPAGGESWERHCYYCPTCESLKNSPPKNPKHRLSWGKTNLQHRQCKLTTDTQSPSDAPGRSARFKQLSICHG